MGLHVVNGLDKEIIEKVKKETEKGNIDNITRTLFYEQYYERNNEIMWAYLASFVSRNAGWNMTDLQGEVFSPLLTDNYREILFLTYERANWLIFSDAFPQLLIYEMSKEEGKPFFHLLKFFQISKYMEREWLLFWNEGNKERLCQALIINEQNLIQKPVIEDAFYNDKVFGSLLFVVEDFLHFSTVIFPTLNGQLYGLSVHGFTKVKNRIKLGNQLSWLLFHSKEKDEMRLFASDIEHTGSRNDYEKFVTKINRIRTPTLRSVYPVIHHHRSDWTDWYNSKTAQKLDSYMQQVKIVKNYELTEWYYKKQNQLLTAGLLEQKLLKVIEKIT